MTRSRSGSVGGHVPLGGFRPGQQSPHHRPTKEDRPSLGAGERDDRFEHMVLLIRCLRKLALYSTCRLSAVPVGRRASGLICMHCGPWPGERRARRRRRRPDPTKADSATHGADSCGYFGGVVSWIVTPLIRVPGGRSWTCLWSWPRMLMLTTKPVTSMFSTLTLPPRMGATLNPYT